MDLGIKVTGRGGGLTDGVEETRVGLVVAGREETE